MVAEVKEVLVFNTCGRSLQCQGRLWSGLCLMNFLREDKETLASERLFKAAVTQVRVRMQLETHTQVSSVSKESVAA